MTICVSVKTRDGVVLGTDSMATVMLPSSDGQPVIAKAYSNARKLVQIGDLPIGVFTYGIGNLGQRTVYSHILEYSKSDRTEKTVEGIAAGLATHMWAEHKRITNGSEERLSLGLYVAGYSEGSALPEEKEVVFLDINSTEPLLVRSIHGFGANWRGVPLPFTRLFNGYDSRFFQILEEQGVTKDIVQKVMQENSLAANVVFEAMPLQDAINFAVYVLRTTIGFTSFEIGTPSCGGQLQIAVISEEAVFQWVSEPKFRIPEDTNE